MNLKDAFAGISAARDDDAPANKVVPTPSMKGARGKPPEHAHAGVGQTPLPIQGTAKSRHPEFEAVKIYVRKETRKRAWRKWEDANGGDFSDLVEMLLGRYLRGEA